MTENASIKKIKRASRKIRMPIEERQLLLSWASKKTTVEINKRIDTLLSIIVGGFARGEELKKNKMVASELAQIVKKRSSKKE